MKRLYHNFLRATFAVLLIQLLFFPRVSIAQTTDAYMAEDAVSLLLKPDMGKEGTIEQFVRLLPLAFGFGESISYKLPRDTLLTHLISLGVIPKDVDVNFNKPLTKGQVSVILVKTLLPDNGSLVERLLISVFTSQEACFRVALRQELIPPGNVGDVITSRELAAIILAVTVLTTSDPLPQADTHCIRLFMEAIVEKVISIEEIKEILDLVHPNSIKSILAL